VSAPSGSHPSHGGPSIEKVTPRTSNLSSRLLEMARWLSVASFAAVGALGFGAALLFALMRLVHP